MPAIHIRDIPQEVLDALKRRAGANHRSLQMEIRHALFKLAEEAPGAAPLPWLELNLSPAPETDSTWSREEIYGDDAR